MKFLNKHKKSIIITSISIAAVAVSGYTYLTWNSFENPPFMNYRWNAVITEPLAKMGNTDAQYKMGYYWFWGDPEDKLTIGEIEKAIYWWGLAADNGHEEAIKELSIAREELAKRIKSTPINDTIQPNE